MSRVKLLIAAAKTAKVAWDRLPPEHRRRLVEQARVHGPAAARKAADTARTHGPVVARRLGDAIETARRKLQ